MGKMEKETEINLYGKEIGTSLQKFNELKEQIKNNKELISVNLSKTQLNDEQTLELCNILKDYPNLKEVDFSFNNISCWLGIKMNYIFKDSKSLSKLYLSLGLTEEDYSGYKYDFLSPTLDNLSKEDYEKCLKDIEDSNKELRSKIDKFYSS